jgi:hypothetical protein
MKNVVLLDVTQCSFENDVSEERNVHLQLLVTDNVVPSSLILSNLMMEAIRFSETLALTRATRNHIPEDGTLQRKFAGNSKSWMDKSILSKYMCIQSETKE